MLASLRGFRPAWLPGDVLAGLMLAAIAVPEQLATARLASMPAETGLYAFAAGTLAFALFGANRFASVGADSTIAPIFAGSLAVIATKGSRDYASLVGQVALVAGIVLVLARLLRLGWIADLLSRPVTVGFLAGIAVHIWIGQLPAVLGFDAPGASLAQRALSIVSDLSSTNGYTLAIGAGVLLVVVSAERLSPRVPGALLALIGASAAVAFLGLSSHHVAVLGALPAGAPHFGLPAFGGSGQWLRAIPVAFIVALVCMMQTAVVVRAFPSSDGPTTDPGVDFGAVGVGSIVAALAGSFAVDASPPRTAIVAESGGRSQLAGIFAVALVVVLVAFGGPLTANVPQAALGGILIFVGMRIFRWRDMADIRHRGGYEIWLVVSAALLVIVLPIEAGMLCSIALSLVHGVYVVARPPSTELLRIPNTTIWWPPTEDQPGERVAGVLVFAPSAPIAFTNAELIGARFEALVAAAPKPLRLIVISCEGVIDVDYTGARLWQLAISRCRTGGAEVALARLVSERARRAAERTGLLQTIGPNRVFASVQEAINALA